MVDDSSPNSATVSFRLRNNRFTSLSLVFPCLPQSTGSERIGFTSNTLIILRDVYQYKQTAFGLKISTFAKHSFAGDVLISTVSGR